ncbi:Hsp70 family protein [Mycobacterium sp.]|uniref:Hsp70 family protein n=1 Tax=Mycobacterium sp. TaxID=1785 RepID=UPI003D6BA2AA
MPDEQQAAVGLSIGATNLAAVTADRAVTRKPVLTLYGQHPPEVGVPSENPKLAEPGLVITDFVDKVGDPAGIVAADGSTHRAETLLADGLRALAYTATDGRALPGAAVTYPAHWGRPAVDTLRAALSRVREWSGDQLSVLPDFAAALRALQTNPGLPTRGIIAVCDFGGSGTSLTLVDAGNGYQPVAPAVRHRDLSGDLIDQALLNHVVADLSSAGALDTSATSTIGSLTRLRADCRHAKEELSSTTSTTLTADAPGSRGEIEITRAELDNVIRQPLDGFVSVIRETLQRNAINAGDLAAVASLGGGASIPAVTTTLSGQLGVPVIAAPRPHLTAAIGAALTAARGPADDGATALAPTAGPGSFTDATSMTDVVPGPSEEPALAWSESDDASAIMPIRTGEYPTPRSDGAAGSARPQPARPREAGPVAVPWYRRPAVVIVGTALAVLAIGAAVLIALRHTPGGAPTAPGVSTTPGPGTSAPGTESSGSSATTASQAPGSTSPSSTASETSTPPSSTPSTTTQAPTTTTQAPTTTTQASTTTQAPTTTQSPTSSQAPPVPKIPGLLPRLIPPGG